MHCQNIVSSRFYIGKIFIYSFFQEEKTGLLVYISKSIEKNLDWEFVKWEGSKIYKVKMNKVGICFLNIILFVVM